MCLSTSDQMSVLKYILLILLLFSVFCLDMNDRLCTSTPIPHFSKTINQAIQVINAIAQNHNYYYSSYNLTINENKFLSNASEGVDEFFSWHTKHPSR